MKRIKSSFCHFLIICCLLPVCLAAGKAHAAQLSVESKSGRPGDRVQIAVRIDNVTGLGIISAQFVLTFNGNILTARSATTAGTIASSWGAPTFNAQTGQISISMASATPLSGSGSLVIVEFDVSPSATNGQTTQINITQLQLNEGSVTATTLPGTFTVVDGGGGDITLTVGSASNVQPGASVTIPVSISDATGKGIVSMQMDLDFNSSLLTATNVNNTGTITASWGAPTVNIQAGKVRVSMASATPLSGSGSIFLVTFTVSSTASNGQSSAVSLSQVSLNEGAVHATLVNGIITVGSGGDNPVQLALPSTTDVAPGTSVFVPLSIANTTGKNIIAISLSVTYTASFATAAEVSLANGIASSWTVAFNVTSGKIAIAIAGASTVPSDGELLRVRFDISNSVSSGSSSPLNIQDVVLNDGNIPFTAQNGTLQVRQNFEIRGAVRYYFNNQGVRNAQLQLGGASSNMQNTVSDGTYRFDNMAGANYTLTPSKDGDIAAGVVSHFDASMVLRNIVGALNLTPDQKIAADVDGNGNVQALDAANILKYVTGNLAQFPIGEDWVFAPNSLSYAPLSASVANQDFKAYIYGDVSGNYTPAASAHAVLSGIQVSLPDTINADTTKITIALNIQGNTGGDIFSFGGKIKFNPLVLAIKNVHTQGTSAATWGSPTVKYDHAEVAFAIASASPLQGDGDILRLEFDCIGAVGDTSGLYLNEFTFNEGSPGADTHSGFLRITQTVGVNEDNPQIPKSLFLYQNYPNPFNPETTIEFALPAPSHVKIQIYNMLGQQIRSLLDQRLEAGSKAVTWDGKDDDGHQATSGVYLYRIEAMGFKATRKLILMR